jgi:hypothetical protein
MNGIGIRINELLEILVQDGVGRKRELTVTMCRYIVATNGDGKPITAIEIVYDPEGQFPRRSYFCPARRIVHEAFPVSRLKNVRPYVR